MPAYVRSLNPRDLQVTFLTNGKVVDVQYASSPEEAATTAIVMITHIGELDAGDSLTVTHADPGAGATLAPGTPR
jgi:hypothetical protein